MIIHNGSSCIHLMYCTNIHPGERWEEHFAALRENVPRVKRQVSPDGEMAFGLRLSDNASRSLEEDTGPLRAFLKDNGLYVVSLNGFPYGTFHGERVKEKAYLPDWSSPERLEYTLRLARILASLLPDGEQGSVSTVPSHYGKKASRSAEDGIIQAARSLADLEQRTGKHITLALEPEPDCFLDTLGSTVPFFRGLYSRDSALRPFAGVCLDCCHAAVEFESPAGWLKRLLEERIPVPKIQISAALRAEIQHYPLKTFMPFNDGQYLHQTRIAAHSGTMRYPDLPDALAEAYGGEWRVHFHVPLVWEGGPGLCSTRDTMDEAFFSLAAALPGLHLETETYSYGVFPGEKLPLADSIAAELVWTRGRLPGRGA